MWNHLVPGAGIQTHDLLNTSLRSLPFDQGSRPNVSYLLGFLQASVVVQKSFTWLVPGV